MPLVDLNALLRPAQRDGYAVGAFTCCNAETSAAIVEQGAALRSPVLLISAPSEMAVVGPRFMVAIAEYLASEAPVPVCLHVDHAHDLDDIHACIEAGFPSVMIDASRHDFEENVRLTKLVVEMARPKGVTVEGELGAVGSAHGGKPTSAAADRLTDPGQAAEFVRLTGVDALAVGIGNAHGIYSQRPVLDFERLTAIGAAVDVPLVLHGGSGTPADQLHRAIGLGIAKVNVASEVGRAYLDAIAPAVAPDAGVWYAHALAAARSAVAQVVNRWMRELGSAGRVPAVPGR